MLPASRLENSELQRVRQIVFGLNSLCTARPHHALAPHAAAGPRRSVAQRGLLCRLARRARLYDAPPLEFEPEVCLSQLLASKDLCSQEPNHLAFCFEKLRVLKGDACPKDAIGLLLPEAATFLRHL